MIHPDVPAEQPMADRLRLVRCGRCNWPIGRVNLDLPSEVMLQCSNCRKDQEGRRIATFNVLRVIVVEKPPE